MKLLDAKFLMLRQNNTFSLPVGMFLFSRENVQKSIQKTEVWTQHNSNLRLGLAFTPVKQKRLQIFLHNCNSTSLFGNFINVSLSRPTGSLVTPAASNVQEKHTVLIKWSKIWYQDLIPKLAPYLAIFVINELDIFCWIYTHLHKKRWALPRYRPQEVVPC